MPFYLAVPPTEHVEVSAEVRVARETDAQAFRNLHKKTLTSELKPIKSFETGAFRGTNVFNWGGNYNAIMYTAFVYPPNRTRGGEWIRLVALLRQSDCVLMGASWEWRGDPPKDVPSELNLGGTPVSEAKSRDFDSANPYRFEVNFIGEFAARATRLFEIVGGETLAAARFPVVASLGQSWCDAALLPDFKSVKEQSYPARAHRLIVGDWQEKKLSGGLVWPQMKGSFWLSTGTFGERKITVFEKKNYEAFLPKTFAVELTKQLVPVTHKITDQEFTVIRREGKWVYLNRGRAFGLAIGTHLVAKGATLHVIQYALDEKELDVAVAKIRDEDALSPIKVGDKVMFDLKKFPAK